MKLQFMIIALVLLSGAVAGTSYIHGANGLVAKVNDTGIYYYHPDNLGSTSAMTNEAGVVTEEQLNLPFGEQISGSEKYGFTGKERDETGLQYFGARYYSSGIGKFITSDTAMDGMSWYSYGANNPLRYVDPTGNKAEDPELKRAKEKIKDAPLHFKLFIEHHLLKKYIVISYKHWTILT